jgi:DNA-binding SARP family transcriptional activator
MDLEVRLLGPLEIEVAGEMRAIGGLRACRLLTLLLLNENSVVSTDRLVEVLWEEAPQSARQQIHNTVTALRRTISTVPGIDIVTAQIGYRVDVDSDCLDLTRFRSAVQKANEAVSAGDSEAAISQLKVACGLWRGAPLAGLEGQYFVNVATRLEEEHLSATEALMALQVKVGDAGHTVGQLMELVAAHPLRESPRASLMAALHGTGRQADALEVYEEGRRLLVEEFGLDPSADLQALHDRILQGLPVFDSSAAERFPAPPDPADAGPEPPAISPA